MRPLTHKSFALLQKRLMVMSLPQHRSQEDLINMHSLQMALKARKSHIHQPALSEAEISRSFEDIPLRMGECSLGSAVVCVTCSLPGSSPGAASPASLPPGGPIANGLFHTEPAPTEQFSSPR